MPNLKNLITALIAPLSARPKSQFYQTITPVSGETASYTMPVDGFVRVNTSQATKAENYITVTSEIVAHQHTTAPGYVNRVDLPVKKGSYVQVEFDGHDTVWVGFVARVGGGLRAFCRKLCRGFGEGAYV